MNTETLTELAKLRTPDGLVLLRASDLIKRCIVPTRKTLRSWMRRKDNPFPAPVVLAKGELQEGSKNRYSGRHVAWRLSDVAAWVARQIEAGRGDAA